MIDVRSPAPVFDGDLFTDDVLADPYAAYATLRQTQARRLAGRP